MSDRDGISPVEAIKKLDLDIASTFQTAQGEPQWDRSDDAILTFAKATAQSQVGHGLQIASLLRQSPLLALGVAGFLVAGIAIGAFADALVPSSKPANQVASSVSAPQRSSGEVAPKLALKQDTPKPLNDRFDVLGKAIGQLNCASVEVVTGASEGLNVKGFVSSEADFHELTRVLGQQFPETNVANTVAVLVPPFCTAVTTIEPFLSDQKKGDVAPGLRLQGGHEELAVGDRLIVEAAPIGSEESFVYISLLDETGRVTHLMPGPDYLESRVKPGERIVLGGGLFNFQVGGPVGRKMLVLIQTPKPLFDRERPAVESAADYLGRLRSELKKLSDEEKERLSTTHLFFRAKLAPPVSAVAEDRDESPQVLPQ
jgi:hypothetical protein